jgi:hypothetical protein
MTAKKVKGIREQIQAAKDLQEALEHELSLEEKALAGMLEMNIRGKEMMAEWIVKQRRIGSPKPEDLAALERIDPRFVKRIPTKFTAYITDERKAWEAKDALDRAGIRLQEEPEHLGPPGVGDVDKVLKERTDLWGDQRQIWDRLDLRETKNLKVFPTILGSIQE